MKNILIMLIVLSCAGLAKPQTSGKDKIVPADIPWSVRMSDSFLYRHPDYYVSNKGEQKWHYEQGLMLEALHQMWLSTGDQKYFDFIINNLNHYVEKDGRIKTYHFDKFRLDDVAPGRALLYAYKKTNDPKFKAAADTLRKQLSEQPRIKHGGFWHKEIYPHQMWLDGLYMAEPFYADYAKTFNEPKDYDDIINQFVLIEEHTRDPKTGLLYHGWDASKQQKWADPKTGDSPAFWGRAMGWYVMGLVDVLDYVPKDHPGRQKLIDILKRTSKALLNFRDENSKVWYQVLDQGNRKGNYLEASASCMFTYAFAKGARKGYLPQKYLTAAKESFKGILKNFIKVDPNGLVSLLHTCSGAGLGGKPYRDGSFSYYIGVPQATNDFKGMGPFIMAALQLENKGEGKTVGLDYFFNHEMKKDKDGKETQFHYIWEDKENSGYSKLAKVITGLGAHVSDVKEAPSQEDLKKLSIYIIVDPDTTTENPHPNYIETKDIKNIVRWVKNGGVLVLFANDKGNCEFDHLNKLAENFGIRFNGDSRNRVVGKDFDTGKFDKFPDHPIFAGVKQIYLKEISTLKLNGMAKAVLTQGGDVIMASSNFGKGFVFAVGDPWIYNEYIDNNKLPVPFENYKAARNLFYWLLGKANKPANMH